MRRIKNIFGRRNNASDSDGEKNTNPCDERKVEEIIKKSTLIGDGNPARYSLQKKTDNSIPKQYRKITFGERDNDKPHKTILMVGETGTGKTKLINAMINYSVEVQRKDKVWFEITDDDSERTSAQSQTSIITVYGFYLQESPIHLTIIDTPGYGDTRGVDLDKQIAESFLSLSESAEGVHEIDAVCLVIKADVNRLSDRLVYIFDSVQCLFGRDIAENIVLLFTHSRGAHPKSALTAVKEAKIKCAVNDENQPVFFQFDNCQSDAADEGGDEDEEQREQRLNQSWNRSFKGMMQLFKFLDTVKPKTLKMTQEVLKTQMQMEAKIFNLRSRVEEMELKQQLLKQTQEALKKNKNKNFEVEVEVSYKELDNIDSALAGEVISCRDCEENCQYLERGWFGNLLNTDVMKDGYCKICRNNCSSRRHDTGRKKYVSKTKMAKQTLVDLKKEYDLKIRDDESLLQNLLEKLEELKKEKIKLVNEAFDCVETLQKIALKIDSVHTLQHIDVLIEKLKEINEPEKAEQLEKIKNVKDK